MKKILSLLMIGFFAFLLTGCDGETIKNDTFNMRYFVGQVQILGFKSGVSYEEITIPSEVEFYTDAINPTYKKQAIYSIGGFKNVGLKKITFMIDEHTDLKVIDSYAFAGNTDLVVEQVPGTLETIDSYAFYNCTNLRITLLCTNPPELSEAVFEGVENLVIRVPKDTLESYLSNEDWSAYSDFISEIEG